uniref:Uncharacterized protein n=1 Tax=mine drainage metagenome TaxID=410659 RepID=E6QRG9_9ZZZZ
MRQAILRENLCVDANHQLHIDVPADMGDEFEVIVIPRASSREKMPPEWLAMAQLMDESGFAQNILNSPEEDCWNDL